MKTLLRILAAAIGLVLAVSLVLFLLLRTDSGSLKQAGGHEDAYDEGFFEGVQAQASRSAEAVIPIVMELVNPRSVIDVGCARGDWLKIFQDLGVERIFGLDGAFLDTDTLVIPKENFRALDLNTDRQLDGKFDVAVCLEVAEHLDPDAAEPLVDRLTQSAPVVIFSAAVPEQGGTDHINEQWPSYWREIFERKGFVMTDPIRDRIRNDYRVLWFYRQNIVVYVDRDALSKYPALESAVVSPNSSGMGWLHWNVAKRYVIERESRLYKAYASVRQVARDLRSLLTRR